MGRHSQSIRFSSLVRSAACAASLLSVQIDHCFACFLPNINEGIYQLEGNFLADLKEKGQEDRASRLSGSSQLGKGKQNIWPEVGILVCDVLILFVRCYCNSQTPGFFQLTAMLGNRNRCSHLSFDVVQNHLHLVA